MPYALDDKLVIAITSRALFDLDDAHAVFEREGLPAYRSYQREREHVPLAVGTGFPLAQALLRLNQLKHPERLVEVIVVSRNDADSSLRIFNSIEAHGLDITRGAFTNGRDAWPYLPAFRCQLLLSANSEDVVETLNRGIPAALVCAPPTSYEACELEVRIAFDGDAVLFDRASEEVYQREGLKAFLQRESDLADVPMNPGPFAPFLEALGRTQAAFQESIASPIRTSLVTARNAPAHQRVIRTLRAWGVRLDETFFLGGIDKSEILEVLRPHIFFDDQRVHLDRAQHLVPSAQVVQAPRLAPRPIEAEILPIVDRHLGPQDQVAG